MSNHSREYHEYLQRGGDQTFKQWINARSRFDSLTEQATNWCDSNGGKPLVDAPQYSQLLQLERELAL